MFTVRIFSSLLPQLITTPTMLDDKYYCEIVWDFIQNNFTNAVEFEGLPMIVVTDQQGTARTLSLSGWVMMMSGRVKWWSPKSHFKWIFIIYQFGLSARTFWVSVSGSTYPYPKQFEHLIYNGLDALKSFYISQTTSICVVAKVRWQSHRVVITVNVQLYHTVEETIHHNWMMISQRPYRSLV